MDKIRKLLINNVTLKAVQGRKVWVLLTTSLCVQMGILLYHQI